MVDNWRVKAAADSLNVGRERLRSAELLADAGQSRDAISRAYYAVLAAAHACLSARGIRAHSHAGTIRQFSLLFIQTGLVPRDYGRAFARIEGERMDADYEMSKQFTAEDAQIALDTARRFVAMVEGILPKLLEEDER